VRAPTWPATRADPVASLPLTGATDVISVPPTSTFPVRFMNGCGNSNDCVAQWNPDMPTRSSAGPVTVITARTTASAAATLTEQHRARTSD